MGICVHHVTTIIQDQFFFTMTLFAMNKGTTCAWTNTPAFNSPIHGEHDGANFN